MGIVIDEAHFPDPVLREAIHSREEIKDNYLTDEEAKRITVLYFSDVDLRDLEGIQYLPFLDTLNISGCPLEVLDVSRCPKLRTLSCSFSDLKTLITRGADKLAYLTLSQNPNLTELDLYSNDNLLSVSCYKCNVSSLSVARFGKLAELSFIDNPLRSVNLQYATHLQKLELQGCPILRLDVSNSKDLWELICPSLESINLRWNPKMKRLVVGFGTLVDNAPDGMKLERVNQDTGGPTPTPTPTNTPAPTNTPTPRPTNTPTPTPTPAPVGIRIDSKNFPNPTLREIVSAYDWNNDGALNDREISDLQYISLGGQGVLDMKGIEVLTSLYRLDISGYSVATIDLRNNKKLEYLNCERCNVQTLLFDGSNLQELNCRNNNITTIDVSGCSKLIRLDCQHNPLKTLKLPQDSTLKFLSCGYTNLDSISTKGQKQLQTLFAGRIKHVDVSESRGLKLLRVTEEAEVTGVNAGAIVYRGDYEY